MISDHDVQDGTRRAIPGWIRYRFDSEKFGASLLIETQFALPAATRTVNTETLIYASPSIVGKQMKTVFAIAPS